MIHADIKGDKLDEKQLVVMSAITVGKTRSSSLQFGVVKKHTVKQVTVYYFPEYSYSRKIDTSSRQSNCLFGIEAYVDDPDEILLQYFTQEQLTKLKNEFNY
jgi:hypothetical protein